MAEHVHAGLRIGLVGGQGREDDARGAEHQRDRARPLDTDPERGGRAVTGTRCHGHARRGAAGDLGRLQRARHPRLGQLERIQHGAREATLRDIEQQRPGGVGDVDRPLAAEPQPDVVLGQQHVADARIDVRLVRAQPQQLGGREAGQGAVARQGDQPLETHALLDLGALRRRALVVPEDRRPQHALLFVQRHEPVHLAREPDTGDLMGAERGDRLLAARPPVLGRLLRPARPRLREAVVALGPGDDGPAGCHGQRLDTGRADVETHSHRAGHPF